MKRFLAFLLAAALAASMLCVGALAVSGGESTDGWTTATTGCSFTYDTTNKNFDLTYTSNTLVAGNQYVLLIVKGTPESYSVSSGTIMYIDQTASGTSGDVSVSFADFMPRSLPDCVVLLGGAFAAGTASPVVLGTIIGHGSTVTGSVSYLGTVTRPVVKLTDTTNASSIYTATVSTPSSGTASYTFDAIPDGTYTLSITKTGHKAYSGTVTINADNTEMAAVTLLGGDVDADGGVTLSDLSSILTGFGQSGAGITVAGNDIDEDGGITLTDLSTTLTNFGK